MYSIYRRDFTEINVQIKKDVHGIQEVRPEVKTCKVKLCGALKDMDLKGKGSASK